MGSNLSLRGVWGSSHKEILTFCLLWSLGVREVVGSRPGRGNSKESFSSNQETGKVFSPEMPFCSKF